MKKIKYLFYRLKWHLAKYFWFDTPTHIDIELTSKCNLSCKFCHQKDKTYQREHMKLDTAKAILVQAKEIGIKSVKLNWRGEPTLHPDFAYIVKYAKELGFIDVMVNTNLTHVIDFSCFRYVDTLLVSIDSMKNEIYEDIRGRNLFAVLDNLTDVFSLRKGKIIINRTLTDKTESDKEFKELLRYHIYQYFLMKDAKKALKKIVIKSSPAMPRNKRQDEEIYYKNVMKLRKYCGYPSQRLTVGWNGKIYPCCVAYNEKDDILTGRFTGLDNDLLTAYRRAKYIRDKLKKNQIAFETCKNCTSRVAYK